MNNIDPTPEQKKELTIQALGIAGFTEKEQFQGMYTQEHGQKTIVVNLNESPIKPYFNVDGKKITEDDEYKTIAKVSKIITEAEDGQMPSRTTADIVVNVGAQEQPDNAQTNAKPAQKDGVDFNVDPDTWPEGWDLSMGPRQKESIENAPAGHSIYVDNPPTGGSGVPKLSTTEIVHSTAPAVPSDLSVQTIKKYINDKATDEEAYVFLQLCRARGLNPFLKEAYLIKYDHVSPATMVVGKDAFMKRAELHPEYDGFEAGIIVEYKDSSGFVIVDENRVGTFLREEETLLGGWAKVYRKDHTRPVEITVSMKEFNTGKSSWKKMPATMIRKVALVQGHREAFPSELSGMYDQSEMGVEVIT